MGDVFSFHLPIFFLINTKHLVIKVVVAYRWQATTGASSINCSTKL